MVGYVGFLNGRTMNLRERYVGLNLEVIRAEVSEPSPTSCSGSRQCQNHDLPLLPLPFWKENPHIASVEHYNRIVFSGDHGRYRSIRRGCFIEETVGQDML